MRFIGFDGRTYPVNAQDYRVYNDDESSKSSLHLKARSLLHEVFSCDTILEEVALPGSKRHGKILYADFLIPTRSLIVEVHGKQHYEKTTHFHKTAQAFNNSKLRDSDKIEWAELNGLTVIELPYSETVDEWRKRLCRPTDD